MRSVLNSTAQCSAALGTAGTPRGRAAIRHRRHKSHTDKQTIHSDGGASAGAGSASPPQTTFTPLGDDTGAPWWNSPLSNPFNGSQLQFYASLVKNINLPPHYLLRIYRAAGHMYRVPWQLLAAINRVETDYGADLRVSSAGAVGWMQFEPGTWATYGMSVDSRMKPDAATPNPYVPRDAIFSAARYLHASGASHSVPRAVFSYNHATWYVVQVLSIAQQINEHGLRWNSSRHRKIAVMRTTARLLNGMPYTWGGGHGGWGISLGYDCSGFVSAVLHSVGFLRVPADTQTLPWQRGIKPGRGRLVTIYDRTDGGALDADHVIIEIKGQFWESGGSALSGGAARVHRIPRGAVTPAYLESFNLILHPWGL